MWVAIFLDSNIGDTSHMGVGNTEQEAIENLHQDYTQTWADIKAEFGVEARHDVKTMKVRTQEKYGFSVYCDRCLEFPHALDCPYHPTGGQ